MHLNRGNGRSLKDWHIFIKVVELKSISLSAKELHLSIPAVSKSISRLEEYVHATLFHRNSRRLEPTEAGWIAYSRAREITSSFYSLLDDLRNPNRIIGGGIKLSSCATISSCMANQWAHEYTTLHPEASVIIDSYESNSETQKVSGFDSIYLKCGDVLNEDLVHRTLTSIQPLLCASPKYLKKNQTVNTPAELRNHNLGFYYVQNYSSSFVMYKDIYSEDISTGHNNCVMSNNALGILNLVLQGKCIGVALPEWLVIEHIKRGELLIMASNWKFKEIPVHLVWQHRQYYSCIFKDFTNFIENKWNDLVSQGCKQFNHSHCD